MIMRKLLFTLAVALQFTVVGAYAQNITAAQYIERYKSLAISSMEEYGIPASIKLAQGLVESSNGNSRLAREANNHFGIKCKSDWTGDTILHDDDAKGECFRKYDSPVDSYRDHSEFLVKSPRYAALFKLEPTDYKGWARVLASSGYATNPKYSLLLIKAIEDNELFLIDEQVAGGSSVSQKKETPVKESEPIKVPVISQPVEDSQQFIEEAAPTKAAKVKKAKKVKTPKATKGTSVSSSSGNLNQVVIPIGGASTATAAKSSKFSLKGLIGKPNNSGMTMPNNVYNGPKLGGQGHYLVKSSPREVYKNNNVDFVLARDGETFEVIAQSVGISSVKLMAYNEVKGASVQVTEGSVVYIAPKLSKVQNGFKIHTVAKGETLHSIAQRYGVKCASLAKINGVNVGYNVSVGQRIRLL